MEAGMVIMALAASVNGRDVAYGMIWRSSR
jgi:hypothetical protein